MRTEINQRAMANLADTVGLDLAEKIGARILERARATAPVVSGEYRDSLRVVVARDSSTGAMVVQVGSDVPYAGKVNARTGNLPKAIDAAGGF